MLLRAGLADKWLTEQEFFNATAAVWLALFFNAASDESIGWLERRYLNAPDREEFAEAFRSVELAAALGCLALSTPEKATGPDYARFELASALGVARLPWLWQDSGNERIAQEIAELYKHTSRGDVPDWKSIEGRWLTLIRRGNALNCLERAIKEVDLAELRDRIKRAKVTTGELLWQGRYGFCVAKADCERAHQNKGEVLILQRGDATKFMGPFLMPVAGLLDRGVLDAKAMPTMARRELMLMVKKLQTNLGCAP